MSIRSKASLAIALLLCASLARADGIINGSGGSQAPVLTNASVQTGQLAPTGTASATGVMMGMGLTGCTITPVLTGRVHFEIAGTLRNTAAGNTTAVIRFGTGTAPSNAGALTGTQIGAGAQATLTAAGSATMNSPGIATGLTLGTAVWFDAELISSTGTSTIVAACNAFEF